MSLENSPARDHGLSGFKERNEDLGYWYSLIDEKVAASELDVTDRTMQKWRQTGDGPDYVRLSARCIRYTRAGLRAFAEARIRKSTSDPGKGAS